MWHAPIVIKVSITLLQGLEWVANNGPPSRAKECILERFLSHSSSIQVNVIRGTILFFKLLHNIGMMPIVEILPSLRTWKTAQFPVVIV